MERGEFNGVEFRTVAKSKSKTVQVSREERGIRIQALSLQKTRKRPYAKFQPAASNKAYGVWYSEDGNTGDKPPIMRVVIDTLGAGVNIASLGIFPTIQLLFDGFSPPEGNIGGVSGKEVTFSRRYALYNFVANFVPGMYGRGRWPETEGCQISQKGAPFVRRISSARGKNRGYSANLVLDFPQSDASWVYCASFGFEVLPNKSPVYVAAPFVTETATTTIEELLVDGAVVMVNGVPLQMGEYRLGVRDLFIPNHSLLDRGKAKIRVQLHGDGYRLSQSFTVEGDP
jgi:hypothetical protein